MKQRIVTTARPLLTGLFMAFSILSIGMRPHRAFAQLIEVEEPESPQQVGTDSAAGPSAVVQRNSEQRNEQRNEESVKDRPVVVNSGMAPTQSAITLKPGQTAQIRNTVPSQLVQAPTNQTGAQTTQRSNPANNMDSSAAPEAMSVSGASTGIGGSNPGNANTGGVQVQSVNVQANPVADGMSSSSVDLMRRDRMRKELENENHLIEKVERGRLDDEQERSKVIDGFSARNQAQATATATAVAAAPVQTIAVTPIASGESRHSGEEGNVTIAVEELDNDSPSQARFSLTPFIGKRWSENNNSQYSAENRVVFGVNLEGRMNRYFSIEGVFTYGHDTFDSAFFQNQVGGCYSCGGGYGYGGGGGGGYGGYNGGYYSYNSTNLMVPRSRNSYDVGANAKLGGSLGSDKIRPYGVIGILGMLQTYDIDNAWTDEALRISGLQRSTTHLLSNLGAGIDFKVAEKTSVGTRFEYQYVLNKANNVDLMNDIWGDAKNRYLWTANVQLIF